MPTKKVKKPASLSKDVVIQNFAPDEDAIVVKIGKHLSVSVWRDDEHGPVQVRVHDAKDQITHDMELGSQAEEVAYYVTRKAGRKKAR